MKRKAENSSLPQHDYRAAIEGALSWLGNRYLLAQPAMRVAETCAPYFAEQRRWHPPVRKP